MSFLNLPWQWDVGGFEGAPADIAVRRWRRGPVTFYRYAIHLGGGNHHTSWWIYIADDLGFAVHLPAWLVNWAVPQSGGEKP